MTEPATALTDYAIALECLLLACRLLRFRWVEYCWAMAFCSVSLAAMLAGTFHGFRELLSFTQEYALWQGARLALTSASFFMVVAAAGALKQWRRWGLIAIATLKLSLIWAWSQTSLAFMIAVVDYMSALGIVLLVYMARSLSSQPTPVSQRSPSFAWMIGGLGISAIAALILVLPWPSHWQLSPEAVYHLIQMAALYSIYRSVCAHATQGSLVSQVNIPKKHRN